MTEEEPKISQADIDKIVAALERMEKRRKIMLVGYFLAAAVLLVGEVGALYIVGRTQGASPFWILLIPFFLTGAVLWGFGRWATLLRRSGQPPRS